MKIQGEFIGTARVKRHPHTPRLTVSGITERSLNMGKQKQPKKPGRPRNPPKYPPAE